MLNYNKIFFNETDEGDPIQYFFGYDITESELDRFLAYYIEEDNFASDTEVVLQELCLTEFSDDDYKLEAIFNLNDNTQSWITLYDKVNKNSVRELLERVTN